MWFRLTTGSQSARRHGGRRVAGVAIPRGWFGEMERLCRYQSVLPELYVFAPAVEVGER